MRDFKSTFLLLRLSFSVPGELNGPLCSLSPRRVSVRLRL